jgi:hypothetical protein
MHKPQLEDDEDKIARDGEIIRVSMFAMDSTQRQVAACFPLADGVKHQPGYAQLSDAELDARQAMYDRADQKLSERWKNPPALAGVTASKPATPPGDQPTAYDAYDRRITERWKQPATA